MQFIDDVYIGKGIFVTGLSYFKTDVEIDGILRVTKNLRVGGESLATIIDTRIEDYCIDKGWV